VVRWVRLDSGYFENPKVMVAGRDGRALHIASICWSGSQLTDGHVPEAAAAPLLSKAGVRRGAVEAVVEAGLWVPNGDGWDICGYLERNPSATDVEEDREQWRRRQRRARQRAADGRYAPSVTGTDVTP
jgi:hypothetical protein